MQYQNQKFFTFFVDNFVNNFQNRVKVLDSKGNFVTALKYSNFIFTFKSSTYIKLVMFSRIYYRNMTYWRACGQLFPRKTA